MFAAILMMMAVSFCCTERTWGQEWESSDERSRLAAATVKPDPGPKPAPKDLSRDEKSSLSRFRSVYTNAEPPKENRVRAGLEIAAFYGVSLGYYYATLGEPKWQEYKNVQESLEARFLTGDAYRFDFDSWELNVGHIVAGTGYYLLARSNDLSLPESFLYSAAASTAWELFGELQNEFSINDAVMTPFAGFAVGEVMYQMGEFFQHSSNTVPNRVLGYLFGPSAAFHRWLDHDKPRPPGNVDKFGFTTDVWHRFRLFAGGGGSTSQDSGKVRGEVDVGFDFELVTAEKYARPGEASLFYGDSPFNELMFNIAFAGNNVVDLRVLSKTAFWGSYEQSISREEGTGGLYGHSLFMGLSSALEYYSHEFAGVRREDSQAICDLVGPTFILDTYCDKLHLRAILDAYPTFSMVRPAAGEFYDQTHSLKGVKSVYRQEGYYYALGVAAAGRVDVDYGPFGLGGQIRYHTFNSIEGRDMMRHKITHDIELEDERLGLNLTATSRLFMESLKLGLSVEKIYRWSDIGDFAWNTDETRYMMRMIFEF